MNQLWMEVFKKHSLYNPILLGEGGTGAVYRLEWKDRDKQIACKVSRMSGVIKREAELMRRIRHPMFPAMIDFLETEGTCFLFMEYVAGTSLKKMAEQRGGFSERQTALIGLELAEGLLYLHRMDQPVIYRDLKPDNIIVCQDGHVRFVDLGGAGLLEDEEEQIALTPAYCAPEQMRGEQSKSCDVYGLGRTLGEIVFDVRSGEFSEIIDQCTNQDPHGRPFSMMEVRTRLKDYLKHLGYGTGKNQKFIVEKNIWLREK